MTINDVTALGVLRTAIELGLNIPQDVSIAGYDDVVFAAIAEIPLTTVSQPTHQIGCEAVRIILKKIEQDRYNPEHYDQVLLQPQLIVRKSCGKRTKVNFQSNTSGVRVKYNETKSYWDNFKAGLNKINTVINVASGFNKVESVLGALRGKN